MSAGATGLFRAAAGGALVSAAVLAPFVAAGAWWNMVHGVASQAREIYLSMEGYNFWWMAGHFLWVGYAWQRGLDAWSVFVGPVTRIPFVRAAAHGLPFLRVAGTMLALAGIGWGIFIGRRARELSLVAAVGAFSVHAYAVLGAQVHENHLFAAMPLLVIAAATRRRFVPMLAGVSAFLALSMLFYIFGDEEGRWVLSRSFTLLDTTLLLAAFNCGLFVWHGAVLRAEAGSVRGAPPHVCDRALRRTAHPAGRSAASRRRRRRPVESVELSRRDRWRHEALRHCIATGLR